MDRISARQLNGRPRPTPRILQFGGGCNGCSMVDVTLKEGIEKQLLNEFPELKGVRDLTEHQRGEHSYY